MRANPITASDSLREAVHPAEYALNVFRFGLGWNHGAGMNSGVVGHPAEGRSHQNQQWSWAVMAVNSAYYSDTQLIHIN